jgi:hypothetical protein
MIWLCVKKNIERYKIYYEQEKKCKDLLQIYNEPCMRIRSIPKLISSL